MCVSSQTLIRVFNTNNQTNVKKTQLLSVIGQSSGVLGEIHIVPYFGGAGRGGMGFGWLPSLILRCFCGRRRPRSSQNLQDLEPEAGSVTESESVITELSPEGSPVKTPTETSPTGKSVSRKSPAGHLGPGDRTGAEPGGEAENGESSSAGRESRGSPRETDRHRHSG